MPVSMSAAAPAPSKITVLSSGTFDSANNGVYEDAGNFTVPAMGTNQILYIEMFGNNITGVGTAGLCGIHTASGNAISFNGDNGLNAAWIGHLSKSIKTSTKCTVIHQKADAAPYLIYAFESATFNFSADEVIYLKTKGGAAGEVFRIKWIAYLLTT